MCHYEAAMDKIGEDIYEYKMSEFTVSVKHMAATQKYLFYLHKTVFTTLGHCSSWSHCKDVSFAAQIWQ